MPKTNRQAKIEELQAALAVLQSPDTKDWDDYFEDPALPLINHACVYLSKLRQSGETNMYGASPFLCRRYSLDKKAAEEILLFWLHHHSLLETGVDPRDAWRRQLAKRLATAPTVSDRAKIIQTLPGLKKIF